MFRVLTVVVLLLGSAIPAVAQSPERDYGLMISELIQATRRYPPKAKAQFRSGAVVVQFVVNAKGRIVRSRISASSCYADFDAEALAMLRRASPLPPFPAAITRPELTFAQPIVFSLHPAITDAVRSGTSCSGQS